jgi:23S rRNA (adenine2503-C2)-methyltransferase
MNGQYALYRCMGWIMERAEALHLIGLTSEELSQYLKELGEPSYRGKQLFKALHERRLLSFEEITDLPKALRDKLSQETIASALTLESRFIASDGTRRYLMKTRDNLPVETVFIPEEKRDTICFSSQSGCPLQCDFCLTAKLGLLRTLTAGEIVEQIIVALNDAYGVGAKTPHGTNLVAMGAGEPLLAFESLTKALSIMAEREGLYIVPNRVNVSTAGVVPRIREFGSLPNRPHLAISLSAPTDELRDRLMPINKRWPIHELMTACQEFQSSLKRGERVTFEYVMLDGVNDSDEHARQLANLLNHYNLRAKVNLIPHNTADPLPYRPSTEERVQRFKSILESKGIGAYVRRPRGRDVYAACGQLASVGNQRSPIQIDRLRELNQI